MKDTFKALTVLAVGNERAVRKLASGALSYHRYNILAAKDGRAALTISREFPGEIDLLLSAFEMPHMSGVDLAAEITRARPHVRVLLMSEVPGGLILLDDEWHFLHQPFIPLQLQSLIDGVIDSSRRSTVFRSAKYPGRQLIRTPDLAC